jgi:hypothetical protein
MSKITFRADDDLVERLESLDASKSEAMREALREYLDGADRDGDPGPSDQSALGGTDTIDEVIRERVDELVGERLDELVSERLEEPVARRRPPETRDLNVNVTVDGVNAAETDENAAVEESTAQERERKTPPESEPSAGGSKTCDKCGETVSADHVYCPNCGEKASHRVFCECGDELRSDWAFCPSCGRRTSAADVLERT